MKIKKFYGSHNSTYTIAEWADDQEEQFTVYSHEQTFASLADAQRFINNKNPAPRLEPDEPTPPKMGM